MSAFVDISITNKTKPLKRVRIFNKPWVASDGYAYSLPHQISKSATGQTFKALESDELTILVLGQFNTLVSDAELIYLLESSVLKIKPFKDPPGQWLILCCEKKTHNWHVFTDRFGTEKAYHRSGDHAAISTYFGSILDDFDIKNFDQTGFTCFVGNGFFPEDLTYHSDVKVLKPASHYIFNESLALQEISRYWNWEHSPDQSLSMDKALAEFHHLIINVVGQAVQNKRVALPLSGGLDSRTLAGVLTHKDFKQRFPKSGAITSFSYEYANGLPEAQISSKIAATLNLPFKKFIVPNYLFNKMAVVEDSVEMFQTIDGTRQIMVGDWLAENSDVVLGGHWGDVWLDASNEISETDLLPTYQKKMNKRGREILFDLLHNFIVDDPQNALDDYFTKAIEAYQHIKDSDFRMKAFKTDQWSFRWTLASIKAYQAGAYPVLPFYDGRMADFFEKIPTAWLVDRKFQVEYLKKFHPDLARITWQEYGANLFLYPYVNNRQLWYRVISKLRRMLTFKKFTYRNWEVFYLNTEGRRSLEKDVYKHQWLVEKIGKERLDAFFAAFYANPKADNGYAMCHLHTFSRFINKYCPEG